MKRTTVLHPLSLLLILMFIWDTTASAQERVNPHFFAEMTGGVGTAYWGHSVDVTGIHHIDKTFTYGQWSPSVGLEINDRWSLGVRMTFQTGDCEWGKYTVTTLFGQYRFLNLNKWHVYVEGKGSYYHDIDEYKQNAGEIGVSLGTEFEITDHLSAILNYIYTGVEVGDNILNHPHGCIGNGRYTLDFSPRRLQIGLRYTF